MREFFILQKRLVVWIKIGNLSGLGGTIFKYGLSIPQEVADFSEFSEEMLKSEQDVMTNLVAKLNNA